MFAVFVGHENDGIITFTDYTFFVVYPLDTGRKLNVQKTFRRRHVCPGGKINHVCSKNYNMKIHQNTEPSVF